MPKKKPGRNGGRSNNTEQSSPLAGSTPSMSSSAYPKAVTSSATAKLIEGIGRKSSPLTASLGSGLGTSTSSTSNGLDNNGNAGATNNNNNNNNNNDGNSHHSNSSNDNELPHSSGPSLSTLTAAALAVDRGSGASGRGAPPVNFDEKEAFADTLDEPSCDEFEDALEEPAGDPDAEAMARVIAKDPTNLKVPSESRGDWATELETLRIYVDNSEVSDDEKIRALHEALQQRVDDVRAFEEHRTAAERRLDELRQDRDVLKKELAQAQASKQKMEENCRELQTLKSTITTESKKIVEEERVRQVELNDKFAAAMKDVEEKMSAESEVREHFIKENEELRTKLNKFTETYEAQEAQLSEQNSARAKEMEAARERLKEYQIKSVESGQNATNLDKKNKVLTKTTAALRAELQTILTKFDGFHESVSCSNKKHGECKEDIDGLSAQIKELEDENIALKNPAKVQELTKEKETVQKQRDMLEKLIGNLEKEIATAKGEGPKKGKA